MKGKEFRELTRRFSFDCRESILQDGDFGIVNGHITTGVDYSEVFSLSGLWAPPYLSADFRLDLRLSGEKVRTTGCLWYPFSVKRTGVLDKIEVSALTVLVPDARALVMEIRLKNTGVCATDVPLQILFTGGMDYEHLWGFSRPAGTKAMDTVVEPRRIRKVNNDKCLVLGTDLDGLTWFGPAGFWETRLNLPAGGTRSFSLAAALGERESTLRDLERIMTEPSRAAQGASDAFDCRVKDMFDRLPVFEASHRGLTAFYYRSLVHYLTNRWQVPEFALKPLYSTGSVKGGCLASYLWDYAEGWELHPLFDPEATKAHIRQYLAIDITSSYAFEPLNGTAVGPWYPVNQEKIIGLIRYYIRHTGDTAFLEETVSGRTVWQWVLYHAALGDDLGKPAFLYDYGIDGEHHLELRRGYPYHGVMPDLNGRRAQNYLWAYELSVTAGHEDGRLRDRAEALRKTLREELWSEDDRWFRFRADGCEALRYTVQMFKLLGGPALDGEELRGLLSHLNGEEFLSEYGLHSLSKSDPAYDQADIDNGGGGICSVFPPQIIERLYRVGLPETAEDILRRILWWGEKTPYWGDSFAAGNKDYRHDTPLQCTIGGVAGAQCILFGMFGIEVLPDGRLRVDPHPPSFSPEIALRGLKLRGHRLDILAAGDAYRVEADGLAITSRVGTKTVIG